MAKAMSPLSGGETAVETQIQCSATQAIDVLCTGTQVRERERRAGVGQRGCQRDAAEEWVGGNL